jgi:prepilin-type N-terminal cleavage/methylation domain-containing protein
VCLKVEDLPMRFARTSRSGFTLIEILIVVVILGILAALVVPEFASAGTDASEASLRANLQRIRVQIEYYKAKHAGADPAMVATQWNDLVSGDYLQQAPQNNLNGSLVIAGAAGPGVGWIWRDKGNGTMGLFATDETFVAEFVE